MIKLPLDLKGTMILAFFIFEQINELARLAIASYTVARLATYVRTYVPTYLPTYLPTWYLPTYLDLPTYCIVYRL